MRLEKKADLAGWLEEMWVSYAKDVVGAGYTAEEAAQNVERNKKKLLVNGVPNNEQHIFDVIDDDVIVGTLWLASRSDAGPDEWYVYDIVIDEALRGESLGRRTMESAEEFVKSHGGTKLGLNVFGPNTVARHLYESMGYQTMAIGMKKELA